MANNHKMVIGISRTKSVIMTFIALILFSVTAWFMFEILQKSNGFDKVFLLVGTSLLTLTFAASAISGVRMLVSKDGLIIDDDGIEINVGPNRGQFIQWKKIVEIRIRKSFRGNRFLLIVVEDPTDILRESHGLNRLLLVINNVSHKTPVSITATWLNSDLIEIMEVMREKMDKYRKA